MQEFLVKNFKVIAVCAVIAAMAGYIFLQHNKINALELRNGEYERKRIEAAQEREIILKEKDEAVKYAERLKEINDSLEDAYIKIPTDETVKKNNTIIPLNASSSWDSVLRANEMADDSSIFKQ